MPRDNLLLIVFDHVRICASLYCNLHCAHCYVPEEYRDQYKRLMEPSQFSLEEMMTLICRYCLRKVSVPGGETPFNIVLLGVVAIVHASKQGLQVQLNPGGLGQVPIADVISIFDDRERLTFQFRIDGANRETDRFRGRPGVYASVLRQMFGAVNGGALVRARMTVNRHNLSESLDAYLLLSSIGIDAFRIKPMFASRRRIRQLGCSFAALPSLLPPLPRARSSYNGRLPDRRPLAERGKSCNSPGLGKELPINITRCAEQPHVSLADAA
ncbi:radical SAM protein [Bradyrhizobium australiense]|uniref:Radical SAM protein n=1 Tax=Bradyrhizobium australiense TaxID=2721161 RepID=A0A7Y4LZM8_9BRAD|nr:radical SAM protein [Bradyrhizobium australiense]NOJ43950.1 radical SAM protein [Bradyrhizobium australiense]